MVVLPASHVGAFCMRLCVSGGSYVKYTYMIGRAMQVFLVEMKFKI